MKGQSAVIDLKKDSDDDATPAGEARDEATAPLPPQSKSPEASAKLKEPSRARVSLPEKPRRLPEMPGERGRRPDKGRRKDGKMLVVGARSRSPRPAPSRARSSSTDISGIFEGDLTAREYLVVRATGRITGKVRFGELEIERGGQIIGDLQVFGEGAAAGQDAQIAVDKPAK